MDNPLSGDLQTQHWQQSKARTQVVAASEFGVSVQLDMVFMVIAHRRAVSWAQAKNFMASTAKVKKTSAWPVKAMASTCRVCWAFLITLKVQGYWELMIREATASSAEVEGASLAKAKTFRGSWAPAL